jgi:FHS family L-fucose permease-like MFS transporter
MKWIRPAKMLGSFALVNILLLGIGMIFVGWVGLIAILMASFFMSLMFPTIFALGIKDLGPHTKEGASLIVMSIIGGAIFTPLMGVAFQLTKSMAISMCVPLVCYAVVAGYAFWGSQFAPSQRFDDARPSEVPCD